MSGLEEQRTNINKLIENYTNELNALRIRSSSQTRNPNLIKNQKLLINHINSLTENLNAIQNYQRQQEQEQRIVQQRITNRNVPSDKDSDEELLKELEEADEEEEKEEEKEEEEKEEEKDDEESGVKPVKEKKYTPLINKNTGEIEMVDLYKKEEKEEKTGFSETIVRKINVSTGPKKPNTNPCPQIFNIGKKVNNKFFIPSQFPNLTKKKSLLKEGRKHMKTKNKNRKGISRTEISKKDIIKKDISKKDISKKDISKKDMSKKDISKKDISKKDISRKSVKKNLAL